MCTWQHYIPSRTVRPETPACSIIQYTSPSTPCLIVCLWVLELELRHGQNAAIRIFWDQVTKYSSQQSVNAWRLRILFSTTPKTSAVWASAAILYVSFVWAHVYIVCLLSQIFQRLCSAAASATSNTASAFGDFIYMELFCATGVQTDKFNN
jgi:hypothetical protein